MTKHLLTLLLAAACLTAAASFGSEPLVLRVQQIKMLRGLHSLSEHSHTPDLKALRTGPGFQGTFPLYFSFGADGCFGGFYTADTLGGLHFDCRFGVELISLNAIIDELRSGATAEAFGLASGRAQVLVLMPAMMSRHCDPCSDVLDKVKQLDAVERLDAQVSIVDVQL